MHKSIDLYNHIAIKGQSNDHLHEVLLHLFLIDKAPQLISGITGL